MASHPAPAESRGTSSSPESPLGSALADVLITGQLALRPSRVPSFAAENRALVALAREMTNSPRNLLQKLVEMALELCQAGSSGISIPAVDDEGEEVFAWVAMAGSYASFLGNSSPRYFSPCGTTLEHGLPQLFSEPSRYFHYLQAVEPRIFEGLVIPFYAQGRPLGTIWIAAHEEGRRFDAEDARIMTSLGELTGAALQILSSLDSMTAAHHELERTTAELRQVQEVLQEADRRKDEFLATLAHELRNPLAPIGNALHILRADVHDPAAHERALDIADRQVRHLVRLVDDLLEVSRITRGKLELRKERIDLGRVFLSAVETSRPLIEEAGHELTLRLPDEPLFLHADPVRLAQVIANLLNNAAKYTDPGGRICLTARREGEEAVVQVQDSGIGLSPEMLPIVFEMFTQIGGSADCHAQGGLGIGLALVRSLAQLHGGRAEAQSPGLGQGSTFTVRLPLPSGQDRDAAARPAEPAAALPGHRILVVDDNRDAAETMGVLLEILGNDVQVTHDGPSALRVLDTFQPTVVLLDIGMPGMDGYEVARQVRRRRERDRVTLIAVTGWGQEEDQRRSREAGFNHHLVKPVDLGVLRSLLATP